MKCAFLSVKKLLFLCIASITCVSCATYQAEPLSPETSAQEFAARSLRDPKLNNFVKEHLFIYKGGWPPDVWDVNTLTMAAIYYQPSILAAYHRWEIACAKIIKAEETKNPFLGISSTNELNSEETTPWIFGILFTPHITTASKGKIEVNQAKREAEAAKIEFAITIWKTRNAIRRNLLALYKLEKSIPLLKKQAIYEFDILQIVKQQVANNDLTPLELMRSTNSYLHNSILLQEAREERTKILSDIAKTVGVPISALSSISFSFKEFEHHPSYAAIPFKAIQKKTLLTSPDLMKALEQYEASQYALQLEIAKQYPNFDLGPAYTWDKGISRWGFGLGLLLPVFNQNKGGIAEAKAKRAEQRAKAITLQASILHQLEQAQISYSTAIRKLQTVHKSWQLEESQLKKIRDTYQNDPKTKINLLTAELEFITLALLELDMQVQVQSALSNLEEITYTVF